jgi:hypothetical protein
MEIVVGPAVVEGVEYQVILRKVDAMNVVANAPVPNAMNENANAVNAMQEGGRKKMKKAKGTRKLSPYMKFAQEARPKVLKENPNMKSDIIGVGRKIGEMWRGLSDAEKARY